MRIDSSGNVNLATGRLRIASGSDEGSQLNLWADSNEVIIMQEVQELKLNIQEK
jgi:hypothetical protein